MTMWRRLCVHLRCQGFMVNDVLGEHPLTRAVFEASKMRGPLVRVLDQASAVVVVLRLGVAVCVDPLEDVDAVAASARHPWVACALGVALAGFPVRVRNIVSAEAFCNSKHKTGKQTGHANVKLSSEAVSYTHLTLPTKA